jgi:hypothetical protein
MALAWQKMPVKQSLMRDYAAMATPIRNGWLLPPFLLNDVSE